MKLKLAGQHELYPNSVFANVFDTNRCLQTTLFFRPVNRVKLVISGPHSGSSSCMLIDDYPKDGGPEVV